MKITILFRFSFLLKIIWNYFNFCNNRSQIELQYLNRIPNTHFITKVEPPSLENEMFLTDLCRALLLKIRDKFQE